MKRGLTIALLVAFALVMITSPAAAADPTRLVVVLVPGLAWSDLSRSATPNLMTLASRSGLADVVGPPTPGRSAGVTGGDFTRALEADGSADSALSVSTVELPDLGLITGAEREARLLAVDRAVGTSVDASAAAVLLLGTRSREQSGPAGSSPMMLMARGVEGYLSSPGVRRPGVLSVGEAALLVDRTLSADPVPPASTPGNPGDALERAAYLLRLDRALHAVETLRPSYIIAVSLAMIVLFCISAVIIALRDRMPRGLARISVSLTRVLILAVPASLAAGWLHLLFVRYPQTPRAVLTNLSLTALGLWALLIAASALLGVRRGIALAGLFSSAVWLADQWFGAPLSYNSIAGYSLLQGLRFYGIGNEGAVMLVAASIVALALLCDEWAGSARAQVVARYILPALGAVIVATCVLPFLGANVGVAIWGTVAFALAALLINGVRMTWVRVLVLAASVAAVVVLLVVIDLNTGTGTHLAQLVRGGDLQGLIASKLATSFRVLTTTPLSAVAIALIGVMAWFRWRPRGAFAVELADNPALGQATTALLVAGGIGWLTEDSGFLIPGFMVVWLGIAWLSLMLAREGE